jgi:hypothetical protein
MGGVYIEKNPALAKSYFEKALKSLENLDDLSNSTKEAVRASLLDLMTKVN